MGSAFGTLHSRPPFRGSAPGGNGGRGNTGTAADIPVSSEPGGRAAGFSRVQSSAEVATRPLWSVRADCRPARSRVRRGSPSRVQRGRAELGSGPGRPTADASAAAAATAAAVAAADAASAEADFFLHRLSPLPRAHCGRHCRQRHSRRAANSRRAGPIPRNRPPVRRNSGKLKRGLDSRPPKAQASPPHCRHVAEPGERAAARTGAAGEAAGRWWWGPPSAAAAFGGRERARVHRGRGRRER
mmetsp:Transcript_24306/g.56221  ORF Transcript_24306/g.56221 Transcript_24306/m.56221 type:complete len:243 (+) Transcript_24306:892-1620(+)